MKTNKRTGQLKTAQLAPIRSGLAMQEEDLGYQNLSSLQRATNTASGQACHVRRAMTFSTRDFRPFRAGVLREREHQTSART
jgi:hypothetical protein